MAKKKVNLSVSLISITEITEITCILFNKNILLKVTEYLLQYIAKIG